MIAKPRLDAVVLILIGCSTWALSHAYAGLFHDAELYTLLALAHVHPASLSQDVFLKFGSQDRFTIFSPLYAEATRLVGVECAAAALTVLSQCGLVAGAWALARAVIPASPALAGVAVLVAIPGVYGSDRIFTCIEPFLTPRMGAEALVLGSLAAAFAGRRRWALILLLAAALLHPVMALAGACALCALYVGRRQPVLPGVFFIVGLPALVLAWFMMPPGEWGRFDPPWLALVTSRSPYLFLTHWHLGDWSWVAVTVATLSLGIRVSPTAQARDLCTVTLVTVLAGFALSLIACDGLHLVFFTQLQPWRWQWVGTVVAALLLPAILRVLWQHPVAGRASALLLVASWVFDGEAYALVPAGAALAALAILPLLKPGEARWVFWGSCSMLALAVLWRLASNLEFTEAHYLDPNLPLWVRRMTSFCRDGVAPLALVGLTLWLRRIPRPRPVLILFAGLVAALLIALLPHTWRAWTVNDYTPRRLAQFAGFRQRIPSGADVFWADSPVGTWTLLDRPSYLSVVQTSGMVFSRQSALELNRRAQALSAMVAPAAFMNWSSGGNMMLSPPQLMQACRTGAFAYLVTGADLGVPSLAEAQSTSGAAWKKLRLYHCPAG